MSECVNYEEGIESQVIGNLPNNTMLFRLSDGPRLPYISERERKVIKMCECAICEDYIQDLLDRVSHSWNPFVWLRWMIREWKHQKNDH